MTATPPAGSCLLRWTFRADITVTYAPATLTYTWRVNGAEASGVIAFTTPDQPRSAVLEATPAQDGTTAVTITVEDRGRALRQSSTLTPDLTLHCRRG